MPPRSPNDDIRLGRPDSDAKIAACWPVMRQLRPRLNSREAFVEQVRRQRSEGYRILTVLRDETVAALAGWRLQENFVFGRHLYVDDLVTHEAFRGLGLGSRLLAALADEARHQGCGRLVLDTAASNADAQRFYAREGMRLVAMKFVLSLDDR